jgi:hypothetical protein
MGTVSCGPSPLLGLRNRRPSSRTCTFPIRNRTKDVHFTMVDSSRTYDEWLPVLLVSTLLEATVSSSLVSCEYTNTVVGVRATPSGSKEERGYLASMVVIANGSSNFRKSVFIPISPTPTPTYRPLETSICGSFHGLILRHPASDPTNPILPMPYHGTVVLIPDMALYYSTKSHQLKRDFSSIYPRSLPKQKMLSNTFARSFSQRSQRQNSKSPCEN